MSDPSNYYNHVQVGLAGGASYQNITVSAQTTVKSSSGYLRGIAVNSNNISAIALYDNTVSGGTTIATLPTSGLTNGHWFQYDANFVNGLVVSTGSSNTNITVIFQ